MYRKPVENFSIAALTLKKSILFNKTSKPLECRHLTKVQASPLFQV